MVGRNYNNEPHKMYGVLDDRVEARRWTGVSLDCYKRKCQCHGCPYEAMFRKTRDENGMTANYRCRCKAVVVKLIRTIGLPNVNADYNNILDDGDE